MLHLAQTSILPAWVVLPVSGLTMLVVACHVLATHAADMPLRRRRLRVANGLLMMFVTALLAYALGVAGVVETPRAQPADAMATVVRAWGNRRVLKRQLRHAMARDLGQRRAAERAARQGSPRGQA